MYFVGIDIFKYKHNCFIATETGHVVCSNLTIQNIHAGFAELLRVLESLGSSYGIRIGVEAIGHYALNLKLFLEKARYSFMEFNPVLLNKFTKSQSLRRTKTDAIDCGFYSPLVNDGRLQTLSNWILSHLLLKVIDQASGFSGEAEKLLYRKDNQCIRPYFP